MVSRMWVPVFNTFLWHVLVFLSRTKNFILHRQDMYSCSLLPIWPSGSFPSTEQQVGPHTLWTYYLGLKVLRSTVWLINWFASMADVCCFHLFPISGSTCISLTTFYVW
jgi:hypothetical protein